MLNRHLIPSKIPNLRISWPWGLLEAKNFKFGRYQFLCPEHKSLYNLTRLGQMNHSFWFPRIWLLSSFTVAFCVPFTFCRARTVWKVHYVSRGLPWRRSDTCGAFCCRSSAGHLIRAAGSSIWQEREQPSSALLVSEVASHIFYYTPLCTAERCKMKGRLTWMSAESWKQG